MGNLSQVTPRTIYQETRRSFKLLSRAKTLHETLGQSKTRVSGKVTQHLQLLLLQLWPSWGSNSYVFAEEGKGRRADRAALVSGPETHSRGSGGHLPRVFKMMKVSFHKYHLVHPFISVI